MRKKLIAEKKPTSLKQAQEMRIDELEKLLDKATGECVRLRTDLDAMKGLHECKNRDIKKLLKEKDKLQKQAEKLQIRVDELIGINLSNVKVINQQCADMAKILEERNRLKNSRKALVKRIKAYLADDTKVIHLHAGFEKLNVLRYDNNGFALKGSAPLCFKVETVKGGQGVGATPQRAYDMAVKGKYEAENFGFEQFMSDEVA